MSKVYVVQKNNYCQIFNSYKECEHLVVGQKHTAIYKFKNIEEARQYCQTVKNDNIKLKEVPAVDKVTAYVDGSYKSGKCGCGGLIINPDGTYINISEQAPNVDGLQNVSAELQATLKILSLILKMNVNDIDLYYDYEGIEKFTTAVKKDAKPMVKKYNEEVKRISQRININFKKIKSHSGDICNNYVDKLARKAVI